MRFLIIVLTMALPVFASDTSRFVSSNVKFTETIKASSGKLTYSQQTNLISREVHEMIENRETKTKYIKEAGSAEFINFDGYISETPCELIITDDNRLLSGNATTAFLQLSRDRWGKGKHGVCISDDTHGEGLRMLQSSHTRKGLMTKTSLVVMNAFAEFDKTRNNCLRIAQIKRENAQRNDEDN